MIRPIAFSKLVETLRRKLGGNNKTISYQSGDLKVTASLRHFSNNECSIYGLDPKKQSYQLYFEGHYNVNVGNFQKKVHFVLCDDGDKWSVNQFDEGMFHPKGDESFDHWGVSTRTFVTSEQLYGEIYRTVIGSKR